MRWADHTGMTPSALARQLTADDVEAMLAYERRVGPVGTRRMDRQAAHVIACLGQWKKQPDRDDLMLYREPDDRTAAQREADLERAEATAVGVLGAIAKEVVPLTEEERRLVGE